MKKRFVLFLVLSLFIFTGCNSNNKEIDLDNVFNNLKDEYSEFVRVDEETLTGAYGIDLSVFEEYLVVMEEDNTTAKMYAVFKTKDEIDAATYEAEYFVSQYKESWLNGYFKEEEALVQDGDLETYGNYIIYVVNKDPDNIMKLIKES